MEQKKVKIRVELTEQEAEQLAIFTMRINLSQIRQCVDSDEKAWAVSGGLTSIFNELNLVGFGAHGKNLVARCHF